MWGDLFISEVKLKLRLIFQNFQNGRHFELATNFFSESDTESWIYKKDNHYHFRYFELLIDALAQILTEIYNFKLWPNLWPGDVIDDVMGAWNVTFCVAQRAHDDVIKWKPFPRYWPLVRGIHRSPVNSRTKPVTRSFEVFFDLHLNKRLRKQSWGWWFETLSRPLWRHCNASDVDDFSMSWHRYVI